jgi:hypothetical protein
MVPSVSTTIRALECKPANGPSRISRPFVYKIPELKSDKLITFSSPSAPQNVLSKGKSLETHNTAVFLIYPLSLNFLTEAQVQCQYLGIY